MTIQYPVKATIDNTPVSKVQANTRPDTSLARSRRCRISEVLRGLHLPSRYCHISHKKSAMIGTAQGIAGVVLRLLRSNAPQIALLTTRIRKARIAARATDRIRPERACIRFTFT